MDLDQNPDPPGAAVERRHRGGLAEAVFEDGAAPRLPLGPGAVVGGAVVLGATAKPRPRAAEGHL